MITSRDVLPDKTVGSGFDLAQFGRSVVEFHSPDRAVWIGRDCRERDAALRGNLVRTESQADGRQGIRGLEESPSVNDAQVGILVPKRRSALGVESVCGEVLFDKRKTGYDRNRVG